MDAQELLNELLALKEKYGSLEGKQVTVFIDADNRIPIKELDVFLDRNDTVLHSIEINLEK